MSRTAIATQIRSTILAMLAAAHDVTPATHERFRRVVSVRKLKDRRGDPATLSRAINVIESEIVTADLADIAMPDLPAEIADLMRQVWHAAVATQLDDVVKLKTEAQQSVEAAETAMVESSLRVEMLREELEAARSLLAARDTELAQARSDLAAARAQISSLQEDQKVVQTILQGLRDQATALEQTHREGLAAAQQRYEGLSKQLSRKATIAAARARPVDLAA